MRCVVRTLFYKENFISFKVEQRVADGGCRITQRALVVFTVILPQMYEDFRFCKNKK